MHFSRKLLFVSLKVGKISGFYAILMYFLQLCDKMPGYASVPRPDSTLSQAFFLLKTLAKEVANLALFQKIDICLSKSSSSVYVVELQVYQIQSH